MKVARAEKHVHDLDLELRKFADRDAYRIVLEPGHDPGNPHMIALALRIREEVPKEFSLIVGDAFHNLRSALDHLACCLVPGGKKDSKIQFPFTQDANTFDCTIKERHISKARPAAIDGLRGMKPYRGGNHALYGIQIMDNLDKHRLLHTVVGVSGVPKGTIFRFGTLPGASVIDLADLEIRGTNDGQKLIVIPAPVNMKLGDELKATLEIVFGNGPFANVEILRWLRELVNYVRPIIENFRPFLPVFVIAAHSAALGGAWYLWQVYNCLRI